METVLVPRNISLDLKVWQRLEHEAKARKTSRSALVRQAVSDLLGKSETKQKKENA